MRAALQVGYGDIDSAIQLTDVAVPRPGPGNVVVQVSTTTLNRKDLFALHNLSGPGIRPRPPLPHVNGGDAVGRVAEVGPGVDDVRPGDRVVVYSGLFCGRCEWCAVGETSACATYGVIGEQTWGAHAEFVRVPATNVERVPDSTSEAALACAGGSWLTAWRALVVVGQVRPGESVLVVGASGGVGTGAIRIARLAGCSVIAAVGGSWKVSRALEAGADHAIDYLSESLLTRTREITAGAGVDMVLDSVGANTWRDSINCLRPFGRMAICGATSGDVPAISIREIYQQHRRILGAPLGSRSDFRQLVRCLVDGRLQPLVHATLPLERVHEALNVLDAREFFGKIVLTPGSEAP